ncbi:MFS transporter [Streptomyces sp. V1I1]|uniref:MFS transporter n=1 Tax=Streptomyces sp. V1I1 TaxID=3042272 RepID=UPI0027805465|nr:MFS transporter [Streptomyces sp. V1I1]MDQ0939356.1 EmrB/QacA subfamily drug resistance transporter [Streptomyces sp. V1I1]
MVQQASTVEDKAAISRFRLVFAVVAAGVAMSNLDLFVVNVAIPNISSHFDEASLSSLSWVLNAYAVVFAALLVPAGSFADRTGARRAYLLGISVFTVASVLCAVAPSVWFLVAARVVQSAGAALLIPASLGILLAAAPPERRGAAVRNWAALSGLAAALGPVIGGALAQADWRWIFLINVPVGVATVVVGRRAIAPSPRRKDTGRGDLIGAALLTAGIGAVALGLVKAPDWGWSSGSVAITLAAAVVLLALFVWRSAKHPAPVLPLDLLRIPAMGPAMLANLLFAVAFGAMLLSAALWCQDVWHWSALQTGLAISPGPLMVPLLSKYAGMLVQRFGAAGVSTAGCALFAVGLVWWIAALSVDDHDYVLGLLPGMVLTGIGVCFTLPTLVGAAVTRVPPTNFSTGSGVVTMARQAGSVVGVAGLVAVLGKPYGTAVMDAFRHGWIFTLVATVAAAAACCLLLPHTKPAARADA